MTTAPPSPVRSSASGSSPVPTAVTKPSSTRIQPSSCSVSASSIVSTCASTSRDFIAEYRIFDRVEVITPRTLDEALRMKSERPDARPIAGGTDLLVELNFDRTRPETILNLAEVPELKGWARENGSVRLAAGLTYTEAMQPELAELLPALAEASRTVGSPQIRNRGTIGGNLGTASPAGDAHPPLLVEDATVEIGSTRGVRTLPLTEFFLGPKRNALAEDELVLAVRIDPSRQPQTFMKVGPRNAMVIAVCSLAVGIDRERGELRAAYGSAGPVPALVTAPLDARADFPQLVADAVQPDRRRPRHRRLSPPRSGGADQAGAGSGARMKIRLVVNGEPREADVWAGESLLTALRDTLELPGSKNACEQGECGSCSVLIDGDLVCSCLVLAAQADGHEVTTVEGLRSEDGLHRVQQAFVEAGAVQCGFCTPGLVVATAALLERVPSPSDDVIREELSGNLCRCTGYAKIFDAVRLAASRA